MRAQRQAANGRQITWFLAGALGALCAGVAAAGDKPTAVKENAESIQKHIADEYVSLEKLYKHLHTHPELSLQEAQSAARVAKELRAAGFEVTEKVGGYGVVGVLKNGDGPTILVRTDMDALTVTEQTGLPYASRVRTRDKQDNEVGVMHACGHDMHMTCFVGAARVLASMSTQTTSLPKSASPAPVTRPT